MSQTALSPHQETHLQPTSTSNQSDRQLIISLRTAFNDLQNAVKDHSRVIQTIQYRQDTAEAQLAQTIDAHIKTNNEANNETLLKAIAAQNAKMFEALLNPKAPPQQSNVQQTANK